MKKFIGICAMAALLIFTGCFDTVEESTINDDGSGVYVSTTDLGKILGMLKMFAGEKEEMKELEKMVKKFPDFSCKKDCQNIDFLTNFQELKDEFKLLEEIKDIDY